LDIGIAAYCCLPAAQALSPSVGLVLWPVFADDVVTKRLVEAGSRDSERV
jgi:hypothetical protein